MASAGGTESFLDHLTKAQQECRPPWATVKHMCSCCKGRTLGAGKNVLLYVNVYCRWNRTCEHCRMRKRKEGAGTAGRNGNGRPQLTAEAAPQRRRRARELSGSEGEGESSMPPKTRRRGGPAGHPAKSPGAATLWPQPVSGAAEAPGMVMPQSLMFRNAAIGHGAHMAGPNPPVMGRVVPFYMPFGAHAHPSFAGSGGPSPGHYQGVPVAHDFAQGHGGASAALQPHMAASSCRAQPPVGAGRESVPSSVEMVRMATSCTGGSPAMGNGADGTAGGTPVPHRAALAARGERSPMWAPMMPYAASHFPGFGQGPSPRAADQRYFGYRQQVHSADAFPLGPRRDPSGNTVPPSASTTLSHCDTADHTPASVEDGAAPPMAAAPSYFDSASPASAASQRHARVPGRWSTAAASAPVPGTAMKGRTESGEPANYAVLAPSRAPPKAQWSLDYPVQYYTQGAGVPVSMMVPFPPGTRSYGGQQPLHPSGSRTAPPRTLHPRRNAHATDGLDALSDVASRVSPPPGPGGAGREQ